MGAPSATARLDPLGIMLEDGYQSLITLQGNPAIKFWEVGVTPPGFDMGGGIEISTMHNESYRTMAKKKLISLTDGSVKVAYDPAAIDEIIAQMLSDPENGNDVVTYTYPDGSTLAVWGYVDKFVPDELSEGTFPQATLTIVHTNWDSANNEEAGPVLVEVAGT